jgi:hypothetical protein
VEHLLNLKKLPVLVNRVLLKLINFQKSMCVVFDQKAFFSVYGTQNQVLYPLIRHVEAIVVVYWMVGFS